MGWKCFAISAQRPELLQGTGWFEFVMTRFGGPAAA
jgi:hypothetical protein